MARDLTELINTLSNPTTIEEIGAIKIDGTSITQLRVNPTSRAIGVWSSLKDTTKTTASDGTVFSTTETSTEKYPVTIIYTSGDEQVNIADLTSTVYIWSSRPNVTLNIGSSYTYGLSEPLTIIGFSYNNQTISISGSNFTSFRNLLSDYTRKQNSSRPLLTVSIPPDLSENVSTNELLITDLDGRLTVLEGDYATQAYVDSAISGIVDGAPGVLDTLNEIAASLGDEPNFAFSINSRLDSKANIQDPIFFGTVTTDSITIDNNVISTNITNASLELEASGTGQILAKSDLTVGFGGNLVVTSGQTFLNTLIAYTASGINIQGSTSFTDGVVNFQSVSQTIVPLTGATGVVTHNLSNGAVFFHSSISANFTANFTNVPTTDDRGIGVALVLNQGGTGYLPTAVQINGASVTLRWAYNTVPTPSSSQIDTVSFTLIRTGATWYVIGQHTNFA